MFIRILVVIVSLLTSATHSKSTSVKRTLRSSQQLSLEDLLYFDEDATQIWNFTEKYNILPNKDILNSNQTHLKCVEEINSDHQLIGPYLLNITINNVSLFLYDTVVHFIHGNTLSFAEVLEENITRVMKDNEVYYTMVERIIHKMGYDKEKEFICFKNSSCACLLISSLEKYWSERKDLGKWGNLIPYYTLFGSKIDPPIRAIVMILGLVLNSALLVTFIKEKSVWRESNICIINLVINNFLILAVYTPLQYIHKYHHYNMYTEYSFHIFEDIVLSASMFIVLMVSAQRYFDVCRAVAPSVEGCRVSPTVRCWLYSSFIWLPSVAIAIFTCSFENPSTIHEVQVTIYFIINLLLLAVILVVFNSLTARKLQGAVERGHISIDNENITSSTVVLAITGTYYLIFTLFFFYLPFEKMDGEVFLHYYYTLKRRIFSLVFHNMFSLYPTVIVLVLYKSSGTFRKYLRKYLFRCWLESGEEKYVTMSSLKSDEN